MGNELAQTKVKVMTQDSETCKTPGQTLAETTLTYQKNPHLHPNTEQQHGAGKQSAASTRNRPTASTDGNYVSNTRVPNFIKQMLKYIKDHIGPEKLIVAGGTTYMSVCSSLMLR